MLVINDLHIGVNRTGGTTPQSQFELRDYLRSCLGQLLDLGEREVTINGDFFDGFTVDTSEVIKAHAILAEWLDADEDHFLDLVAGNHDWNPRGDKVSSFHLLAHFLKAGFPGRVQVHDTGYAYISGNLWCIPHMPNQALFDLEIDRAIGEENAKGSTLLLHANYKNGFAENSDHSLNINDDQVGKLMIAGWNLVLGHEHIGYELRGGRVKVIGNQFPSSVADCIGNRTKHALVIDDKGARYVETWSSETSYCQPLWEDLHLLNNTDYQFIRVMGEATAAQSADVIKAISTLRQRSTAFVITNAVKVEGAEALSEMAEVGAAGIKAFDVLGAIYEQLEPLEVEAVKGLLC